MNDRYSCPLCTETYGERTDLCVHLEVNHRKSDVVKHLVDLYDETTNTPVDGEPTVPETDRPTPSAD